MKLLIILQKQQKELKRLFDLYDECNQNKEMADEIYMSESTLLRAEKNAKRFGEDAQDIQIAMAKLYLYNAVEIVIKNGKEGIISFAEGDEQRMMLMGLKRYTKYTNYPNVVALRNKIAEKLSTENKYCF